MTGSWYAINVSQLVGIAATAVGMYAVLAVFIRLNGLRSLTKMSSFDFVTTLAIGSTLAAVMLADRPSLLQGVATLAALFIIQGGVAWLRKRFDLQAIDNAPVLLMDGSRILQDNLRTSRVTLEDLFAKLREANVLDLDEVHAVVLESTGDVSVLHGSSAEFDRGLLEGVPDS